MGASAHHWWTPGVFHPLACGACAAADTGPGFVWLVFLCLLGVRASAGAELLSQVVTAVKLEEPLTLLSVCTPAFPRM